MARVLSLYRILVPPEADLDTVKSAIPPTLSEMGVQILEIEEAPLAFGVTAIRVLLSAPEEEGVTDRIEQALSSIEGVSSVELERESRQG